MLKNLTPVFNGPLVPAALEAWLGQCEDAFAIYTATKTTKMPVLQPETKICMMGSNLLEPTMAAWWSAKRADYLLLTTVAAFEAKIRNRFLPKAQKVVTLRDFFLCVQGNLSFTDYAAALTAARNTIPSGSTTIPAAIFKYHLLFHSHPALLLRIIAIHTFDIDSATMGVDNLVSLMAMQWESLTADGLVRSSPALNRTTAINSLPSGSTIPPLAPLSDPERARLTSAGGCWKCRKSPGDLGWVPHVGHTCPGDASRGISPGKDFVATPQAAVSAPTVKKEILGAVLLPNDHGEDQPERTLHAGAVLSHDKLAISDFFYQDDDTDEEN